MPTATITTPTVLERVRTGNDKFNQQWRRARDAAADLSKWARLMDQLTEAYPRLDWLCRQMMAEGYTSCLYPNGEHRCGDRDWICWVCPREKIGVER
jgi:hypothetical protein